MRDRFGRDIHALRISVTDRCNMRCRYCVSGDLLKLTPAEKLLTLDEILEVARAGARIGFDSFRVTGGEPLVREGVTGLLAGMSRLPGVRKLSLSTNASLLEPHLDALAEAGVRSLNISLDTLDERRYERITRGGRLMPVLAGIKAALADRRFAVKLNVVLMRGFNDDEVETLASLTLTQPLSVRFIEYMPFGTWQRAEGVAAAGNPVVRIEEARLRLSRHFEVEDSGGPGGDGPAAYVQIRGARGFVGFISPVHSPFCERCNRLRLTADGTLKSCLLADERCRLRDWMRGPDYSFAELQSRIAAAVLAKPEHHDYARDFDMSTVGG